MILPFIVERLLKPSPRRFGFLEPSFKLFCLGMRVVERDSILLGGLTGMMKGVVELRDMSA